LKISPVVREEGEEEERHRDIHYTYNSTALIPWAFALASFLGVEEHVVKGEGTTRT